MARPRLSGSQVAAYYESSPGVQRYISRMVEEMATLAVANLEVVRSNAAIDAQSNGFPDPDPLGHASIGVDHPEPKVWHVVLHDVGRMNLDGTRGSAAANIIELGRPNRLYVRDSTGNGVQIGDRNGRSVTELAYGYAQRGKFVLKNALDAIKARRRRR